MTASEPDIIFVTSTLKWMLVKMMKSYVQKALGIEVSFNSISFFSFVWWFEVITEKVKFQLGPKCYIQ